MNQIQGKITIPEALARFARSHISFEHVIAAERTIKEHKFDEKWNFSSARSLRSLAHTNI